MWPSPWMASQAVTFIFSESLFWLDEFSFGTEKWLFNFDTNM